MAAIKISLGLETGLYQVYQNQGRIIYIYPVDEPDNISVIMQDNRGRWSVEGTDQPYRIDFLIPLPPVRPLSPVEPEMLGYPYPPISSWPSEKEAELAEFLDEIGPILVYDVPEGLAYASGVDVPLTWINSDGQTLTVEDDSRAWFYYHYDRLGRTFAQDIFKIATDPLLGDAAQKNIDTFAGSPVSDLFIPRPDEPERMTISDRDSTFPQPPISGWTDSQKMYLADLLKFLQDVGRGTVLKANRK